MDQEKIDAIRAKYAKQRAALADTLGRDSGVVVAAGIKCGMGIDDLRAALLKTPQALAPLAALDAAEAFEVSAEAAAAQRAAEEAAAAQRAAEEAAAAQRAAEEAASVTGNETPKAPEGA